MSCLIRSRRIPHEYRVLSSANSQTSDFSTIKKISLINMLNNNIKPCVFPPKNFLPIVKKGTYFSSLFS